LFAPPFDEASGRLCSAHPEVPSSGFGYPLDGISSPNLGCIFQRPTLLGFTLQSFRFLSDDQISVSRNPSAYALPCITSAALHRRLSGLLPPEKLYPLLATQNVNPGRGRLLSWALRLSRYSLFFGGLKRISLSKLPSCPYSRRYSRTAASWTSGFYVRRRSAFPPKGRLPA
jgi:hypothetical protein